MSLASTRGISGRTEAAAQAAHGLVPIARSQALALVVLVLMLSALWPLAVRAQQIQPGQDGIVRGQFGDWQIVCKPPPPGSKAEACAIGSPMGRSSRGGPRKSLR